MILVVRERWAFATACGPVALNAGQPAEDYVLAVRRACRVHACPELCESSIVPRPLIFCMFEKKKKSFLFLSLSLTLFRPTSVERDYPLN